MHTEIWEDIPGYEGMYQASDKGRIRNIQTGLLRKNVRAGHGYRSIQLSDRQKVKHRLYVHRIVAITHLGAPPSPECVVNHKNLDKEDNRVENLEWVTNRQNMLHAYINGRTDFRRVKRSDNTTGYPGITKQGCGYQVSICGRYIGFFRTLEDACIARKKEEQGMIHNEVYLSGY